MMSNIHQSIEELDAVLHWRGKHAQVIRERDALQQLLNQRDEQIETMNQQHQGEAVAWRYREGEGAQWRLTDMPPSTWYFDPRPYEVRKLYEKPAPVASPLDYGSLDAVQRLALCRGKQPAPVAVVPDGWTVVPLEATGVMKDAGAFGALPVSCANAWTAAAVWRAMINAAPSPQKL